MEMSVPEILLVRGTFRCNTSCIGGGFPCVPVMIRLSFSETPRDELDGEECKAKE